MSDTEYYTMQQIQEMFKLNKDVRRIIFSLERFSSLLKTTKGETFIKKDKKPYTPQIKTLPKKNLQKFIGLLKEFHNGKYYKEKQIELY